MEKTKILILAASLQVGGAEKFCRDLALYGPEAYEFHYLVFHREMGVYEPSLLTRGCTVHRLPPPGQNYWKYLCRLTRLMAREGYRAVHAHNMFGCGFAMLAAWLAGVPVRIAHAHSELKEGGIRRRIYEKAMGTLIRAFASDRVACSEAAGKRLFGVSDWRTIPNGIAKERYTFSESHRAEIRRKYGLGDAVVIGHAGHLNPVKNQKFLLELLPELRKFGDFRLILLGDGPDKEGIIRRIQELKIEEFVILTGNVEKIWKFYSAMDIFCLPSLYEGMPLALLEARCNGLPSIVSENIAYRDGGVTAISLDRPEEWLRALSAIRGRIPGDVPDIRETMAPIYELYGRDFP